MADTPDVLHMDMQELLAFVAALEAKYAAMVPPPFAQTSGSPRAQMRRADLVRLRASLQRCVGELDRLLGEGDQQ